MRATVSELDTDISALFDAQGRVKLNYLPDEGRLVPDVDAGTATQPEPPQSPRNINQRIKPRVVRSIDEVTENAATKKPPY